MPRFIKPPETMVSTPLTPNNLPYVQNYGTDRRTSEQTDGQRDKRRDKQDP